jgi:hypothetical protein
LTEALAIASENEDRNHEAEIYRVKGELLLSLHARLSGADHTGRAFRNELESLPLAVKEMTPAIAPGLLEPDIAEAESCFERAIEIARKQKAKSFELRATVSLTRLMASQGHRDEARTLLADIYNWFTEGFDTADLQDARSLLDELSA